MSRNGTHRQKGKNFRREKRQKPEKNLKADLVALDDLDPDEVRLVAFLLWVLDQAEAQKRLN